MALNNKYTNSPLQWAGSKQAALPTLLPILEQHRKLTFVEPFVGAANVSLNFESDYYVLADFNRDLTNHHVCLINWKDEYLEECETLFARGFDAYTDIRSEFNKGEASAVRHAAMFQYLNKHGFNGLCRYNKKGEFNVPVGTATKPKNIPYEQIEAMHKKFSAFLRLKNLWYADFTTVFKRIEDTSRYTDCLVYCDPPYVPLNSSFNYVGGGFGIDKHNSLWNVLKPAGTQQSLAIIGQMLRKSFTRMPQT